MVVYGQRGSRYVLAASSKSSDYEGAIYEVQNNADIIVKVLDNSYRNADMENRVINAVNSGVSLSGGQPIDVAYSQGRFVGYILEQSWREPEPPAREPVNPEPVEQPRRAGAGTVVFTVAIGILLSGWLITSGFDKISQMVNAQSMVFSLGGIPMIIGGWIAMLIALRARHNMEPAPAVFISVAAFCIGCAFVLGIIYAIIHMVKNAVSVVTALLPVIILIVAVVYLIKSLFRGRF